MGKTNPTDIRTGDYLKVSCENSPFGIIWTDEAGNILFATESAVRLFQSTVNEFTGRNIQELLAPGSVTEWNDTLTSVSTNEELHRRWSIVSKTGETSFANVIVKKVTLASANYLVIYIDQSKSAKDPDEMLRIISQGTASVIGGDFFRSLAYHLVNTIGIRYAIITECANIAKTRLRTLVYIERENFLDNFEYELAGTPCELVMQGRAYYCEECLEEIFPKEEGIQAYFAVPIYLHNGEIVGHLAIFDTKPMKVSQQQLSILQIFANRAGAEMDRKLKEMVIEDDMIRYQNLFEDSPIGLCEEDFSEVKKYIDKIKKDYGTDLATVFKKYPNELRSCWQKVKRLHANKSQVALFNVQSQQQYFNYLEETFMPAAFENLLLVFESGQRVFEREIEIKAADGERKYVNVKRVILSGTEKDWSKSILSCVDITIQKQVQENLKHALSEVKLLKEKLEAENIYLQEEIKHEHNFDEIVCKSDVLIKVLEKIQQVASTDATVLILGESGTGKELIARAIHSTSGRADRPLVKINCAALPANLIESELFGHEKGAFTGALAQKIGRFELADKGTIFLDEIGELPLELQSKLLRVLQEGEFERLGSNKTIKVNVRVIAATNRELEQSVADKEFRADLYYRLNVFPVVSPPLRDRKEDIPLLVNHFCRKHGMKIGRQIRNIPRATMDALMAYDWPGNVRELENIIERALIVSTGESLELGDWLPSTQRKSFGANTNGNASSASTLTLEDIEKEHIIKVLDQTDWKIRGEDGAATRLGLNPTTLEARMKKLGIKKQKA
ncbi:MAG TPA: sigma 54-interacting transcriptional regulator [Cyclobacteriaceae bacterium]|nr:sigma 54-interacting transcriptional regulator [Cyclobacteriaceae bacterium]